MIFRDLLIKFPWVDIENRIIELYPDQEVNLDLYEQVYENLLLLEIQKDLKKIKINIELIEDSDSDYYDISGIVEGETIGYGLQFLRWEKWLGLPIDQQTLKSIPELDIVTHCLWEMTYSGFSQEDIFNAKMGLDQSDDSEEYVVIEISKDLKIDVPKSLSEEKREKIISQFKDLLENEAKLKEFQKKSK